MIDIDGSMHSGSGTILRYAVALATLMGKPLHIARIRAKREKPGLRPQHLQALLACSSLSGGRIQGGEVGSQELRYWPGRKLKGGRFQWEIGTAGSATMVALTVMPIALFSKGPSRFSITGGLFQDNAPSAFHMQRVLVPMVRKMGGEVKIQIARPGYVPKGQGILELSVEPVAEHLRALHMVEQGEVEAVGGVSLASHLQQVRVAERMADTSQRLLQARGYKAEIEVLNDTSAVQKGAALLLWARTDKGCLLGADRAGRPGRRSEEISRFVVNSLLEDLETGATCDRHVADQLIVFAGLAQGRSDYRIPMVTGHVETNLWLVREILGAETELEGDLLTVQGVGLHRRDI